MTDIERRFHETWLGMVQPIDGLVLSVPVLVDGQVMERHPPAFQEQFKSFCSLEKTGTTERYALGDLRAFLAGFLGLTADLLQDGDALPADLSLYVPEGRQLLKPSLGLLRQSAVVVDINATDSTPASRAGASFEMLVWELPRGLALDKPETQTGTWEYPPSAKFDRLLRACRVPVGLLVNGDVIRLVYAPHGETSGSVTFRVDDMASVGGRPILDAFASLLSVKRFFAVADDRRLPALLRQSRVRQANVTDELAEQVFEALETLLKGFEAAAERDGDARLREALERDDDHLYAGLLTVLLRLVFLLYAEEKGLMPTENPTFARHLSVLGLFAQLQADHGAHRDSMSHRYGAWPRLLSLFRAVYRNPSTAA